MSYPTYSENKVAENNGMEGGLFGKSEEEIAEILYQAQDAFFKVIVDAWNLQTGDFPSDAQYEFDTACRNAIDIYVKGNY